MSEHGMCIMKQSAKLFLLEKNESMMKSQAFVGSTEYINRHQLHLMANKILSTKHL